MGVPAFFRWLSKKYPSVIVPCVEEKSRDADGTKAPVDSTQPNPNNVEFDNLYLDMNGIIHPCTHPEDKPAPKNEDEMMIAIFECIDRLFNIVRPRKLLYMAIDGVAPRAKMNQQRSRRFRASKESVEKIEAIARIREELEAKGVDLPPAKPKEAHFDSNCITPGTPFMDRLSKCLHFYIHDRLNNNPSWKNIKIVLSDANVPGEGEHKIMDYIRRQRASPSHDPNTQHVLCGADADLIMLGLATHEPNFTIIREEFKPNQPKPCDLCGQLGHELQECMGAVKQKDGEHDELNKSVAQETEYIFVRLCVLREYLERELTMTNLPFTYDFERAIDDWVFMCFFVGNDFLPHLPSLEIREGAIDRLIKLYKKTVYKTGGFLTDSGRVNLKRVQLIMLDLGEVEDEIFKQRQQNELSFRARMKDKKKRMRLEQDRQDRPKFMMGGQFTPKRLGSATQPVENARQEAYKSRVQNMSTFSQGNNDAQALKSMIGGSGEKRKRDDSNDEEEPPDEVRLWEDGFKDRYYESKFDIKAKNTEFRYQLADEYVFGLCWVLRYYYQGCASWEWYFPYHYAPFASDFMKINEVAPKFKLGAPFKPLEQLMGVFPAASRSHVPEPWGELMTDPESPIIDFYPTDFKIDLNGKKYAWQGVALLPFVDEKRLWKSLESFYPRLTPEEVRRNVRGDDRLYIHNSHGATKFVNGLYDNSVDLDMEADIRPEEFQGVSGKILIAEDCTPIDSTLYSPLKNLEDQHENQVLCVRFRDPKFPDSFVFPAKRLKGIKEPARVLKAKDFHGGGGFRPQIGMAPARQRASLDASGHRAVNHNSPRLPGKYGSVPPPLMGMTPKFPLMGMAPRFPLMGQNPGNNWQGTYQGRQQQQQRSYGGSQQSHGYQSQQRYDDGRGDQRQPRNYGGQQWGNKSNYGSGSSGSYGSDRDGSYGSNRGGSYGSNRGGSYGSGHGGSYGSGGGGYGYQSSNYGGRR